MALSRAAPGPGARAGNRTTEGLGALAWKARGGTAQAATPRASEYPTGIHVPEGAASTPLRRVCSTIKPQRAPDGISGRAPGSTTTGQPGVVGLGAAAHPNARAHVEPKRIPQLDGPIGSHVDDDCSQL